MTRASPRLTAWLLCATLTTSQLASAQGPSSRADALFREGRDAFKRQDYPTACQKFTESYALDESPGTLLNLGSCEEKTGRVGLAWRHLTDAIEQLPSTDDRLPVARKLLDSLSARVGLLTIKLKNAEGSAVKVRLDGVDVPARQRKSPLAVDPGEHVVQGTTDDDREVRQEVQVTAGLARELTLVFPAAETTTPIGQPPGRTAGTRSSRLPATNEHGGGTQRALGYVAGGLGVVGLGIGIGFGLRTRSLTGDVDSLCPNHHCPYGNLSPATDARTKATRDAPVANAGFIAGGALLALGVVLVLTAPSAEKPTAARIQLVPTIQPQFASISLTGAWK